MKNHKKLIEKSMELGLPVPRLQLTWTEHNDGVYNRICFYDLILPCTDGRNMNEKYNYLFVRLGKTKTGGQYGKLDRPMRDGLHIKREMQSLNIPGYIVENNEFKQV